MENGKSLETQVNCVRIDNLSFYSDYQEFKKIWPEHGEPQTLQMHHVRVERDEIVLNADYTISGEIMLDLPIGGTALEEVYTEYGFERFGKPGTLRRRIGFNRDRFVMRFQESKFGQGDINVYRGKSLYRLHPRKGQ